MGRACPCFMKNIVFASVALLLAASSALAAAPNAVTTSRAAATPAPKAVAAASPKAAAKAPAATPIPLNEKDMREALDSSSVGAAPITILAKENSARSGTPSNGQVSTNGTTEVSSDVGAFDQKAHIAVFTKNVYVENPQFTVTCEKLTAYMHQGAAATPAPTAAGATPAPATPVATPAPVAGATPAPGTEAKPKSGGLEKAVCEGTVVIVQDKIDPDGTLTRNLGHAQKAVYHADTGDIYLFGSPDIQQGLNTCTSLEEGTVMVLNRDGHMTVNGLHRSVIKDSGSGGDSDSGK